MKLTRTTRTAGWLVVAGLLGAALIAPAATNAAPLDGAIWTSLANGDTVNANIYQDKSDVYLNGGPQNCGGSNGLPDGAYYFQVTNPSGSVLLSTDAIKFRQVQVVDGVIDGVSGAGNHALGGTNCNGGTPVRLMPYADTPNSGGEYSVDLAPKGEVDACDGFDPESTTFNFLDCNTSSKNDNYKVRQETTVTTTTTSTVDTVTTTSTVSTVSTVTTTSSIDTVTTTSTQATSTLTTGTGTVSAETGNPTPPSTDTAAFTSTPGTTGGGWSLILIALAGLLATMLLLTPATAPRKR
jgi:hypothetical protein